MRGLINRYSYTYTRVNISLPLLPKYQSVIVQAFLCFQFFLILTMTKDFKKKLIQVFRQEWRIEMNNLQARLERKQQKYMQDIKISLSLVNNS